MHQLVIQQTRWFKGFNRENLVFLPYIFDYNFWAVLVIGTSFFLPFLILIYLFYVVLTDINNLALYIILVFVATFLLSFRGMLRNHKLRFLHSLWHPLFYMLFLLPSKIWATISTLICLRDTQCQKMWRKVIHVYIIIAIGGGVIIGMGVVYNLVVNRQKVDNIFNYILIGIAVMLFCLATHWMIWGWLVFIPQNK